MGEATIIKMPPVMCANALPTTQPPRVNHSMGYSHGTKSNTSSSRQSVLNRHHGKLEPKKEENFLRKRRSTSPRLRHGALSALDSPPTLLPIESCGEIHTNSAVAKDSIPGGNNFISSEQYDAWIDRFLQGIGPNQESEKLRRKIFNYLRQLILETLQPSTSFSNKKDKWSKCRPPPRNLTVMRYGSLPLMTYLPDGDVDLVIATFDDGGVLEDDSVTDACLDLLLQRFRTSEVANHKIFPIVRSAVVEAEVRVLKFTVRNVAFDLSVNKIAASQVGGSCSFVMLDMFDRCLCRRHHLFKRCILLVKAWCAYESRTLGSRIGLMATYALEVLVMCLLVSWNSFSPEASELKTPLDVLRAFLSYYARFNWDKYAVTACGPIPLTWLQESPQERRQRRESLRSFLSSRGVDPSHVNLNRSDCAHFHNLRDVQSYLNSNYVRPTPKLGLQRHHSRCSSLALHTECTDSCIADPQYERQVVEAQLARLTKRQIEAQIEKLDRRGVPSLDSPLFPSATADFLEDCRRRFGRCYGFTPGQHNAGSMSFDLRLMNQSDSDIQPYPTTSFPCKSPQIHPNISDVRGSIIHSAEKKSPPSHGLPSNVITDRRSSTPSMKFQENELISGMEGMRAFESNKTPEFLKCFCGAPLISSDVEACHLCLNRTHRYFTTNNRTQTRGSALQSFSSLQLGCLANQSIPFPIRSMNIVDPLQPYNNLGRSVSNANFYRILESFKRGANTLQNVISSKAGFAIEHFFKNSLRLLNPSDPKLTVFPLPGIWFPSIPSETLNQGSWAVKPSKKQLLSSQDLMTKQLGEPNKSLMQSQNEITPKSVYFSKEKEKDCTHPMIAYGKGSLCYLLQKCRSKGALDQSYVYPKIHRSFEEGIALLMAGILAELRKLKGLSKRQKPILHTICPTLPTGNQPLTQKGSIFPAQERPMPIEKQQTELTKLWQLLQDETTGLTKRKTSRVRRYSLPTVIERYLQRRILARSRLHPSSLRDCDLNKKKSNSELKCDTADTACHGISINLTTDRKAATTQASLLSAKPLKFTEGEIGSLVKAKTPAHLASSSVSTEPSDNATLRRLSIYDVFASDPVEVAAIMSLCCRLRHPQFGPSFPPPPCPCSMCEGPPCDRFPGKVSTSPLLFDCITGKLKRNESLNSLATRLSSDTIPRSSYSVGERSCGWESQRPKPPPSLGPQDFPPLGADGETQNTKKNAPVVSFNAHKFPRSLTEKSLPDRTRINKGESNDVQPKSPSSHSGNKHLCSQGTVEAEECLLQDGRACENSSLMKAAQISPSAPSPRDGQLGVFTIVFRPVLKGRVEHLRRYLNVRSAKEPPNKALKGFVQYSMSIIPSGSQGRAESVHLATGRSISCSSQQKSTENLAESTEESNGDHRPVTTPPARDSESVADLHAKSISLNRTLGSVAGGEEKLTAKHALLRFTGINFGTLSPQVNNDTKARRDFHNLQKSSETPSSPQGFSSIQDKPAIEDGDNGTNDKKVEKHSPHLVGTKNPSEHEVPPLSMSEDLRDAGGALHTCLPCQSHQDYSWRNERSVAMERNDRLHIENKLNMIRANVAVCPTPPQQGFFEAGANTDFAKKRSFEPFISELPEAHNYAREHADGFRNYSQHSERWTFDHQESVFNPTHKFSTNFPRSCFPQDEALALNPPLLAARVEGVPIIVPPHLMNNSSGFRFPPGYYKFGQNPDLMRKGEAFVPPLPLDQRLQSSSPLHPQIPRGYDTNDSFHFNCRNLRQPFNEDFVNADASFTLNVPIEVRKMSHSMTTPHSLPPPCPSLDSFPSRRLEYIAPDNTAPSLQQLHESHYLEVDGLVGAGSSIHNVTDSIDRVVGVVQQLTSNNNLNNIQAVVCYAFAKTFCQALLAPSLVSASLAEIKSSSSQAMSSEAKYYDTKLDITTDSQLDNEAIRCLGTKDRALVEGTIKNTVSSKNATTTSTPNASYNDKWTTVIDECNKVVNVAQRCVKSSHDQLKGEYMSADLSNTVYSSAPESMIVRTESKAFDEHFTRIERTTSSHKGTASEVEEEDASQPKINESVVDEMLTTCHSLTKGVEVQLPKKDTQHDLSGTNVVTLRRPPITQQKFSYDELMHVNCGFYPNQFPNGKTHHHHPHHDAPSTHLPFGHQLSMHRRPLQESRQFDNAMPKKRPNNGKRGHLRAYVNDRGVRHPSFRRETSHMDSY